MTEKTNYYATKEFPVTIAGHTVEIVSKPGVPNWDTPSEAADLLAESVHPAESARVLVIGSPHGALATVLARRASRGSVTVLGNNYVALTTTQETLRRNQVHNATVLFAHTALSGGDERFDAVTLETPNDRRLARRWLMEAFTVLEPGGEIFIAGANDAGIKPILKDAGELFSGIDVLAYRKGNRVGRAVKPVDESIHPDWGRDPGIAPHTWATFSATVRGEALELWSLPGIFSHGELDAGTALLLKTAGVSFRGRVLDIGCGNGILGIVAGRNGATHVDLVDANLLAIAAARENIARHSAAGSEAHASDVISAVRDNRYDVVITNPPFHVGRATEYSVPHAFIAGASEVLNPGGTLYLVANEFIPYEPVLNAHFHHVEQLAASRQYVVWSAEKRR
jgi:16S rRNA (guanine1207-N2)-methyltransferase